MSAPWGQICVTRTVSILGAATGAAATLDTLSTETESHVMVGLSPLQITASINIHYYRQ